MQNKSPKGITHLLDLWPLSACADLFCFYTLRSVTALSDRGKRSEEVQQGGNGGQIWLCAWIEIIESSMAAYLHSTDGAMS